MFVGNFVSYGIRNRKSKSTRDRVVVLTYEYKNHDAGLAIISQWKTKQAGDVCVYSIKGYG